MDESTLTVFHPNDDHTGVLPETLKSLNQQTRQPQEIINIDGARSLDKPPR